VSLHARPLDAPVWLVPRALTGSARDATVRPRGHTPPGVPRGRRPRFHRRWAAARRLTRRAFLAAAVAGATAGPFVFTPARAQSFNWKRFQGKELYLLLTKHPFIDVLERNIPEFESLSGMKVKWETLPEIQARQKMTVEMTANSGGIDAFFTSLHVEKKRFWKAGW
jgi:hypothetical protein